MLIRDVARSVGYIAIPSAAIAVFATLGDGSLALPAGNIDAWLEWLERSDPVIIAFSLLRGAGLLIAWYLLFTVGAGILSRAFRLRRLTALLDHVTLSMVQSAANKAVGVSVISALALPSTALAQGSVTGVATFAAASGTGFGSAATSGAASTDVPTLRHLKSLPPTSDITEHIVSPGSSFWTIAERALQQQGGDIPSAREVAAYWHQLVEHNRDRLATPSNPDFLRPGQVIELPPPHR